MKTYLIISIFLTLTLTSSCQERQNIKVTGHIIDDLTGEPISNAEILVLCWYQQNIDDESFQKEALTTDKSGSFKANFNKGHKIDIASQAEGFLPTKKYSKLESNEINLEIRLKRCNWQIAVHSF
jgi:5-hydroxyisourate hydrolase-like protein (transthyretin family)